MTLKFFAVISILLLVIATCGIAAPSGRKEIPSEETLALAEKLIQIMMQKYFTHLLGFGKAKQNLIQSLSSLPLSSFYPQNSHNCIDY